METKEQKHVTCITEKREIRENYYKTITSPNRQNAAEKVLSAQT